MAKLPARHKVTVWLFRRTGPDEVFLRPRQREGRAEEAPLMAEAAPGERWEQVARRAVAEATGIEPVAVTDLRLESRYTVKRGESAGEWVEHVLAAEVPPGTRAQGGRWAPHYEAKAEAASPRYREAITAMRERLGLKP